VIVDTNVLLRILEQDSGTQGRAARARVEAAREAGDTLAVLAATVLEVAFVLESRRAGYGWDHASVAGAVEAIADEPAFAVEHRDALRAAATTYRDRAVDLHDCFLHAIAAERETRVLSFDDDLRRLGSGERP